jgi:hypothetical protein
MSAPPILAAVARTIEGGRSPAMRAERVKLKSQSDDMRIIPGKQSCRRLRT